MKVFIIRLSDNPLSRGFAEDAFTSVMNFKLLPEYFEGVKASEAETFFKEKGLKKSADPSVKWNNATMGCFASHYSLWEKCLTINEPIVVLEHDGVMVRDPSKLLDQVEDICHLDRYLPFNSNKGEESTVYRSEYEDNIRQNDEKGVRDYPEYHFYGDESVTGTCFVQAYGYLLTPRGAEKLIRFAKTKGVYPADKAICQAALKLQGSNATYVKYHPFYDSIKKQRQFTPRIG